LTGFLTKNFFLKLISILLAVILWYFVVSERSGETAISIPLDFRNIPTSLIIIKNPEESINVRISGPANRLRGLSPKNVKAIIDLSDAKPGTAEFIIQPEHITLPRGLRVTMVSPASLMLRFDTLLKKSLPVEAILVGKPSEGFKLTGVSVDPPTVDIVGAQLELRGLQRISTEEVDISGLKKNEIRKVPLNLAGLHIKSISKEEVKVNLRCARVPGE
jgi:YbbR domain-containing protein